MERAQQWQPPPPCEIPLAPPMALLVAGAHTPQLMTVAALHPGQQAVVTLQLSNVGLLAAETLSASLRGLSAGRLTRSSGFVWYECQPLALFDEAECEGHSRMSTSRSARMQYPRSSPSHQAGHCACRSPSQRPQTAPARATYI